jgi:hypothetical protein
MRKTNKTARKEEEGTFPTTVKENERSNNSRRNHWSSLCTERKNGNVRSGWRGRK